MAPGLLRQVPSSSFLLLTMKPSMVEGSEMKGLDCPRSHREYKGT